MTRGGSGGALTTRGQSFLASGLVLVVTGLAIGLGDLVRLGLLLLLLALAAWWIGRRPARWVRVERAVTPPRLVVGEPGEVTLTVHNAGRRRSPLVLAQERLDHALGDQPRLVVPGMPRDGSTAVTYPVRGTTRGEHALGPLRVQVQDPFGLTERLTRCPEVDTLLVVPPVLPLSGAAAPGAGPGQDEDVADTVALHGEDDVTIRPYRQGDELRRIHWPASAHTGDLMVRQEEQPSRRRAVVLLDRRPQAHLGEGPLSTFEWAVTAVASVVGHLLAHDYDVDLVTDLPHDDHPVGLDEALDRLGRTRPADETQLGAAAGAAARRPSGLVVAVLGTGSLRGLHQLQALRRPGTTAIALLDSTGPELATVTAALRARGWRVAAGGAEIPLARTWHDATATGRGAR